jgi:hypothetical protein
MSERFPNLNTPGISFLMMESERLPKLNQSIKFLNYGAYRKSPEISLVSRLPKRNRPGRALSSKFVM